jgi:hypothetical protein
MKSGMGLSLRSKGFVFASGIGMLALAMALPPVQEPQGVKATTEQAEFFETKIRPVLAESCFKCHGGNMQMAGLRLDSQQAVLKGGESGPALVPGDPDASLIVQAIRHTGRLKMPTAGKLPPDQIAAIEAWVRMGAPWPQDSVHAGQEREPLWSLSPVRKPSVPLTKDKRWARNPVDSFILASLERSNLRPAAEADRRTLIRRLTYDLTGLPPTPQEVDSFLADRSGDAYEKLVDRLLASPRYGERWARHWLDLARYADTKGYVFEEDRNYQNAYTYRAWVIEALNRDLPYDQFILQQLAADRLPGIKDGDDRSALAAMGFLTIGRRFLNNVPDIIDDRIDVTMRGFQGLTVACARCHDHKFDPIPTQDYYSLYAIFDSSEEATLPISERSIREPFERYNSQLAQADRERTGIILAQTKRLREMGDEASPEARQILQVTREGVAVSGDQLTRLAKGFEAAANERISQLDLQMAELRRNAPAAPEFAMAMVDKRDPRDGVVFRRGNPGNRGEIAPRRFLLALTNNEEERDHWTDGSGRLELAKSIASTENPLTARVMVNRVWMHHFGEGLVRTPSDFGYQGDPPTHPELLDWLASQFMQDDWSLKRLHRLLVTSSTYRQTSTSDSRTVEQDPDNRLLARMNRRRLDLEQLRDSVVAAAGDLDLADVGGRSVDLWSRPFSKKRAVYGFVERQNLPGVFRTFDFASPDATSARRFQTTVPQQALFFLNSPFSAEHARRIADRPNVSAASDNGRRVKELYRALFQRAPESAELAAGIAYLRAPNEITEQPRTSWEYGYGAVHDGKVANFTPLPAFQDGVYRGGSEFPHPRLGHLLLNAQGGHPGPSSSLAAIRRWTAPTDLLVQVGGFLEHREARGDGVLALVVSSRGGQVASWTAHGSKVVTELPLIQLRQGETLDFVVDPRGSDAFDAFSWAPTIRSVDGRVAWVAADDFGPPLPPRLSRLALYAQALMMTNEFLFVD